MRFDLRRKNWWRRLKCRLDRHEFIIYFVGLNFGKECRWCHQPTGLSKDEFSQIRTRQWNYYGLNRKDPDSHVRVAEAEEEDVR